MVSWAALQTKDRASYVHSKGRIRFYDLSPMKKPHLNLPGQERLRNHRKSTGNTGIEKSNPALERSATVQKGEDPARSFVTVFTKHYRRCASLAKRFAVSNPDAQDYGAISQLCRASGELLEQAKAARTLTEIYLALDEKHREAVRQIMIARFKEIANSAHASWLRFCDSIRFVRTEQHEIEAARREFEPHAEEFHEALLKFIALASHLTRTS